MAVSARLEILSGDRSGIRVDIPAGSSMRVGRVSPAEIIVADDPLLSAQHFQIDCRNDDCRLKDLGSRFGTFRRGDRITETPLADGDEITAGRSRFRVSIRVEGLREEPAPPPPEVVPGPVPIPSVEPAPPPKPSTLLPAIRKYLELATEPLYAVLDAAREPTIPERLANSGEEFLSLFDGERGADLAPFGPWLVRLPVGCGFTEQLLAEGWGESWGVFLTCSRPLAEVRKHLRRFLLVKLPDGRQVYFRYYDPRVLRTYLQTCTASELTEFFGPISRYFAENAEHDHMLTYAANYKEWRKVPLAATIQ